MKIPIGVLACLALGLCGFKTYTHFKRDTLAVGWGGRFQENTVEVVQEAIAGGLRSVEIDVQVTRDGVPIGLHDPTLDRETNATGPVRSRDWAEFEKDIRRNNGERIDRFDAILQSIDPRIQRVFFDVRTAEVERLVVPIRQSGLNEEILTFCVFSDDQYRDYRRAFPSSEIIFKAYREPSEWADHELEALTHKGYDGLGFPMNAELPTKEFMRDLRRAKLKSFAFIVQTVEQFEAVERVGVDYAVVTGAGSFLQ